MKTIVPVPGTHVVTDHGAYILTTRTRRRKRRSTWSNIDGAISAALKWAHRHRRLS